MAVISVLGSDAIQAKQVEAFTIHYPPSDRTDMYCFIVVLKKRYM